MNTQDTQQHSPLPHRSSCLQQLPRKSEEQQGFILSGKPKLLPYSSLHTLPISWIYNIIFRDTEMSPINFTGDILHHILWINHHHRCTMYVRTYISIPKGDKCIWMSVSIRFFPFRLAEYTIRKGISHAYVYMYLDEF